MPRLLPDGYFSRPPFRPDGGFSFDAYTCVACSQRLKTWESFKAHRTTCEGHLAYKQGQANRAPGSRPRTKGAPLSEEDMGALADLLRQVDEADETA